MMKRKHLSSIANDVVSRCARELNTSVDELVQEFEAVWKPESSGGYSRKLMEFCSSKALSSMCQNVQERIIDGSFGRFTFDMMLSWEKPAAQDDEEDREGIAKGYEEKKIQSAVLPEQDDVSLFYSDIMPLLADNEPSVGENAFVWFGSVFPLAADVVNARFTFETLTATTGNRLHFPAYDMFLREIDKCMKHLQKQAKPKGIELADDEFILHVEGTASSQRVVRHIKETSWPGRLTLTNYALYFEAAGIINYEDAIKIDLSKNIAHSMKPVSTGPWGAPLFDKAIIYESPEMEDGVVLEFPEITSSTRRDHWLAITKEIMLMHRFLSKFNVESPVQAWEVHSRTILSIIRLHAAREMLRISPPVPTKFLIFTLFDEVPKGDYVLEELAESIKKIGNTPCNASSILRSMNVAQVSEILREEVKEEVDDKKVVTGKDDGGGYSSLETAVNQSREEAKQTDRAKATTEELKEEGVIESALILMELLRPLQAALAWFQDIIYWKRPTRTLTFVVATVAIVYKEWIGYAIAGLLVWLVAKMVQARRRRVHKMDNEILVSTASDQSMTESIVSAQYGLITLHELMQQTNIAILKIRSIFTSKAYKHADMVMISMVGVAVLFAAVPFKYLIISAVLYSFLSTSPLGRCIGGGGSSSSGGDQGNRRLKEWWDSIPVVPVRVVDEKITPESGSGRTGSSG